MGGVDVGVGECDTSNGRYGAGFVAWDNFRGTRTAGFHPSNVSVGDGSSYSN